MSVNIQTSSGLVKIAGTPTIDTALSNVSKNPVQNKVVTEKINEINSNLDALEYSEIAGGKNLFKWKNPKVVERNGITFDATQNGKIKLSGTISVALLATTFIDLTFILPKGTYTISVSNGENIFGIFNAKGNTEQILSSMNGTVTLTEETEMFFGKWTASGTVMNYDIEVMIAEGTDVTPYEPYIPSVKMLAEENTQQSIEMLDAKMLGWSVPSECPIQNEVSGNQFIQKVGRVDLGSLTWNYISNGQFFYADLQGGKTGSNNAYCSRYNLSNSSSYGGMENGEFRLSVSSETVSRVYVKDTSYTDGTTFKNAMKGVYLYYELAEEKAISVDGNEAVVKVNESLSVIGKCKNLLKPTLDTYTHNGITFTRNDDGTYSLSGSRTDTSSGVYVSIIDNLPLEKGRYKLTGAVDENNYIRCIIKAPAIENINIYDRGDGVVLDVNKTDTTITLMIVSADDTSQTRIIKPMLTTNLSATYDDFVPYTGDGETLTADVAELKNDLSVKSGNIVYNSCEANDSSLCWCKKSGHVVQCSLYLKNINTTNNWQTVVTLPFRPCSAFYAYDSSNTTDWQITKEGEVKRYALSTNLIMFISFTYITND